MRVWAWLVGCVAVLTVSLTGLRVADAEPIPRIGVVVLDRVNVTADQAEHLAASIGAALIAALEVDVTAGRDVSRRSPEDGFAPDCALRAECIADVAGRLDSDQLLFLFIARVGERVQIDPTWVDVATGRSIGRSAILIQTRADSESDVFAAAATQLLPNARVRPGPAEPPPTEPVVVKQPRRGRRMMAITWAATGVAGAALVGGALFALGAASDRGALTDAGCDRVACADRTDQIERLGHRARNADLLFIAAIAAGATAGYLYYDSGSSESASVGVAATSEGVAFSFGGRF